MGEEKLQIVVERLQFPLEKVRGKYQKFGVSENQTCLLKRSMFPFQALKPVMLLLAQSDKFIGNPRKFPSWEENAMRSDWFGSKYSVQQSFVEESLACLTSMEYDQSNCQVPRGVHSHTATVALVSKIQEDS